MKWALRPLGRMPSPFFETPLQSLLVWHQVDTVVITGGSTILEGMPELAEQVFNLPVRRGLPQKIGGLVDVVNTPVYATGVGLVVYGSKNIGIHEFPTTQSDDNVFRRVSRRMKEWFGEFF